MDGADSPFPTKEIIGIIVCLVFSAFFSGSETALTKISENRARHLLDSEPHRYAILSFWLESKRRILAALLVGNNLVNILASVLAFQVAYLFLPHYAEAISVIGLTLIVLIFAEITPKSIALQLSEKVAVVLLRIIWVVDKLFWIVTAPLSRIPMLLMGRSASLMPEPAVTEDEIEYQIRLGHDQSVFEEKVQGELLMSVVEFSETHVKEVMVPRTDVFGLDAGTSLSDAVRAILDRGHSRIPVYSGNLDEIVGLLYAKDLLQVIGNKDAASTKSIEQLIRKPPMFAPETQKISDLLSRMRRRGQHMAIVVDEFGGTSGLVTLEDIIEELVGEIRDEFDLEQAMVKKVGDDLWHVDARLSIHDLKDATGISLPDSGEYESVGGFVVATFGTIPPKGTVVQVTGLELRVMSSDERHVERIELRIAEAMEEARHE